jgi:hypothetical protein
MMRAEHAAANDACGARGGGPRTINDACGARGGGPLEIGGRQAAFATITTTVASGRIVAMASKIIHSRSSFQ